MSHKRFAIKMITKAIALIVLSSMMLFIFENTIISNNIALGQMSNSDEAYLLMEYYNNIRGASSIAYSLMSAVIVGSIAYDIYKFTHNEGEE